MKRTRKKIVQKCHSLNTLAAMVILYHFLYRLCVWTRLLRCFFFQGMAQSQLICAHLPSYVFKIRLSSKECILSLWNVCISCCVSFCVLISAESLTFLHSWLCAMTFGTHVLAGNLFRACFYWIVGCQHQDRAAVFSLTYVHCWTFHFTSWLKSSTSKTESFYLWVCYQEL